MREDFLQAALAVVNDPNILVNVVSIRVKQLMRGSRPLVESLEKLSMPDTALREIAEGRISYEAGPIKHRPLPETRSAPIKLIPAAPQRVAL